jgi:hypothetical protein
LKENRNNEWRTSGFNMSTQNKKDGKIKWNRQEEIGLKVMHQSPEPKWPITDIQALDIFFHKRCGNQPSFVIIGLVTFKTNGVSMVPTRCCGGIGSDCGGDFRVHRPKVFGFPMSFGTVRHCSFAWKQGGNGSRLL